jgi:hypothetical protein
MRMLDPGQFIGRTVAVVGNSERILDRADGADIDAHDVVIRFNLAWPARRPRSTGARTTHMSVGRREYGTDATWQRLQAVLRVHPETTFFSAKGDPARWPPDAEWPLPMLPDELFGEWKAFVATDKDPTAGATLLYFLLTRCRPGRITLYGCDGLRSRVWYKRQREVHSPCHSPSAEQAFFAIAARDFGVRVVEYPPGR